MSKKHWADKIIARHLFWFLVLPHQLKQRMAAYDKEMKPLRDIGQLLKTQDNRITDAPIFIVQQKHREWGYDSGYSDTYKWIDNESGDGCEASDEEVRQIEQEIKDDKFQGSCYEKIYYKDSWEFVTACFTEQGCKDYLNTNGHNLKEPRIYAEGSYRNLEYRKVRDYLMKF